MKPIKYARDALKNDGGIMTRRVGASPADAWIEPVFAEWELTGQEWSDQHPHTEYVFVLEGCLLIESGGETVKCFPGDFAMVPANAVGRYWAPEHARMLSIYGPNPAAEPSRLIHLLERRGTDAHKIQLGGQAGQ
jgi:uncharacterized cupin superfamily protein